ncbi:MAG: TRAP transporter substrate-binding protein [Rhodopirellula sp.]|nr:TRAP transporter substrate-binding protein [Rhodopirellula sp.]
MTRSVVLRGLLAVVVAAACAGCSPSGPSGPRELKLAYVMAPGGPAHEAAEYFAKLVEEKTAGKVRVKLYPSAQLGNDRELAEGLSIGSVDMVLGGTAPIGWYLPQYGAIEAPFAFRDYEHLDNVLGGPIGREIADAFADQRGILILEWWHRGPRYLTTTRRKATTPADLAGLKLRVPELPTYIEAWRILGTNPTPITYSEIFMALKQGIVEGQENPLEVIYTSSFQEAQKYVMKTEHLLGVFMLMANRSAFEGLAPAQQEAIRQAAVEAGRKEHELMVRYDEEFARKLQEAGMEFVEVDRQAFREPVVRELPKKFADEWAPNLFQRIAETE